MPYIYFALAGICFLIAALLEIRRIKNSRKSEVKMRSKQEDYVSIAHEKVDETPKTRSIQKQEVTNQKRAEIEEGGKFDHLFNIKPEDEEKYAAAREDILKEAERMPEIPKVGAEERFEPLYFRVAEENENSSNASQEEARSSTLQHPAQMQSQKPQPKDWLFFDPSKLEGKDESSKSLEKKKDEDEDNSWTPAFFFGNESH